MDSFLSYCSISCILIFATDGATLIFEMKSNTPVKGSSLEFSCRLSENFNSDGIRIWKGTATRVTLCSGDTYLCEFYKAGYSFTANITGVFEAISSLTTEAEATWRCSYGRPEIVSSNTWRLIVYTIPSGLSITQNPDQAVDLGVNSVLLQCKTTNCTYPEPTVKWIFKDQSTASEYVYSASNPIGVQDICTGEEKIYTSTLTLPQYTAFNDSSDKTGTFLCRIEYPDPSMDTSSLASKAVTFAVYIKSITMSPSVSPLIFLEGQEKSVQCVTSPSRPRPQVRWWLGTQQVLDKITESESSSGNLIVTTSVISLTLNRSHTHKVLYCDATVSGQQAWISSTKSDVTVQYAPYVQVNLTGSTVVGFTVVLMCTAQGELPQYTFHPWIHRVGQSEIRRLIGVNTDSISNLTLSSISFQDMGSYICSVDNSITGLDGQLYQTGDTSLYVQGRPVINEIKTPFTGEPYKPRSIQIPFYSHIPIQRPTFIKQIGSLEIPNTSDISSYIQPSNITMMFYNKNVRIPGYVAVLQFRNLTETDFGNYTLTLTNDKGSETVQLEFFAIVPPSMPKNFFFVHIDNGFMVFGLEKGFNGGYQQTFVVEYRPFGNSDAAWSTVYMINEDNLDNPSSNGTYYIKIPKIQDGQYDFRVYAQNEKGNSSDMEGVYAEIKTESVTGSPGLQVGAVVGGAVGGLLIVVVIVVVGVVMRRCKLNPKMKSYKREVKSTEKSTQLGPLYVNTSYGGDVSATAYESLQAKSTTESPYQTIDKEPNKGESDSLAIRSQGSDKIYMNTAIDSAYRDKEYEGLQLTQIDSHQYSVLSGKTESTEM